MRAELMKPAAVSPASGLRNGSLLASGSGSDLNLDLAICQAAPLDWAAFSWLHRNSVPAPTLARLMARDLMRVAPGALVFREPAADDFVLWAPRTGAVTAFEGRAFALGAEQLDDVPCLLGEPLMIHPGPMPWLRADCSGLVVIDWRRAFDRLRHVPHVAVAEAALPTYRYWMAPARLSLPAVSVVLPATEVRP